MKTLLNDVSLLLKNGDNYIKLDHQFLGISDDVITYISDKKPVDKFEKEYDLCINGHIHNGGKVSEKIINIGNRD